MSSRPIHLHIVARKGSVSEEALSATFTALAVGQGGGKLATRYWARRGLVSLVLLIIFFFERILIILLILGRSVQVLWLVATATSELFYLFIFIIVGACTCCCESVGQRLDHEGASSLSSSNSDDMLLKAGRRYSL